MFKTPAGTRNTVPCQSLSCAHLYGRRKSSGNSSFKPPSRGEAAEMGNRARCYSDGAVGELFVIGSGCYPYATPESRCDRNETRKYL